MSEELQVANLDVDVDTLIDSYFSENDIRVDDVDREEKKLIIRELALANTRREIVPKINQIREAKGLPPLNEKFDLNYYKVQYAPIVETISLYYASNVSKLYRFANRLTRVGKLNQIAEALLETVEGRSGVELTDRDEKNHHNAIRIFNQLMSAIDEQMGKLKVTNIDLTVRAGDKKEIVQNPGELRDFIINTIQSKFTKQLPTGSVDAGFTEYTEYEKCGIGEMLGKTCHCWLFDEQCRVQTDETPQCDSFINRVNLDSYDYMQNAYVRNKLTIRAIAELAGCKDVQEKHIELVRRKIKKHGLEH